MKITIFAYKGFVGIMSDSDGMIAKPGNGNLGCVCDASKVKISQEVEVPESFKQFIDSL